MTSRQTQSALAATTVALWVAAVAILAAAALLPYRVPAPDADVTVAPSTRPATAPTAVAFDDLLDLNLRRPLVDAPATAPAVAAVPIGPPLRLTGIVAEPGHSFAVFVTPTGATEVCAIGQRSAGAEVVAITPSAVTVRVAGQTSTMRLPVPPAPR